MYQDNAEYSSYVSATSHSTHKIREYSSESIHNRSYNNNQFSDSKQTLFLNRRESSKVKPRGSQPNTIDASHAQNSKILPFKNSDQISYVPIVFNDSNQKSAEKRNDRSMVTNVMKVYKKYPKCFKPNERKIPYILQKRNSNSPFILKGQNFSSEDIIPPNIGLEDVFLRNEMKQKNMQGSILIKNEDHGDSMAQASSYVRYFHTSDGARPKNANYHSSSLDPYRDSPPYIQHSGSSDFLGT